MAAIEAAFLDGPAPIRIPIGRLEPGESVRLDGFRPEHLDRLVQLGGQWPPLLVTRSGRIVDGHYRHLAATRLGLRHLECHYFEGSDDESFVEAVRINSTHGLPLTLDERRNAAERILLGRPHWSDRRVAALCGLAHETVGRVRQRLCSLGELEHVERREGRDGRFQATGRAPRLRTAARFDISPVSATRHRSERPRDRVDPSSDRAFTSTESGRAFAEWFERGVLGDEWGVFVEEVPLSRVYEVADEARDRAASWTAFADALTARVHRSTGTR